MGRPIEQMGSPTGQNKMHLIKLVPVDAGWLMSHLMIDPHRQEPLRKILLVAQTPRN